MKRNCSILASLAAASFFAILLVETGAFAQKASVPKPENAPRLSQSEVRKLLALIERNSNGWIRIIAEIWTPRIWRNRECGLASFQPPASNHLMMSTNPGGNAAVLPLIF
jgi:hypothetical protein